MPRSTGRGGSGSSGGGIGGGSGRGGSGRGPSGPGDIWAPFRRKDRSVPTPMEWIRDWAQGRANPIRHLSPAQVAWETGRDVFEQARDEPHSEIGRTMRREFAREGVSFGAGRAVHFDPAKLEGPGRHLGPAFRHPRRLDREAPAPTAPVPSAREASPRPLPARRAEGELPTGARPPGLAYGQPKPEPLPLARRGEPLHVLELRGSGRGPGEGDETLTGGADNDRLTGGISDAERTSAARRQQGREDAGKRQQEKKTLDRVEDVYRGWETYFRRQGWDKAADRLNRMLDGDGSDLVLSREEARADKFIRDGEARNRQRFEDSLTGKEESKADFDEKLLKIEDGETVELGSDNWNADFEMLDHLLERGDLDEALATGASKLESKGSFTVRREGDVIHISGTVTHSWSDDYDFDAWGLGGAGAVALKEAGRAKFYTVRSNWEQEVVGTARIVDGELTDSQFDWSDAKE